MDCVLGINLGTSNAKVALFGIDGRPIAVQTASYPIVRKSGDFAEQDPRAWWQAIQDAANSLMAERADSLEVRVIGLSGQMHGLVLVDRHQVPLRDAIIWPDRRTAEICCDWEAAGRAKAFRSTTGVPLATGFMAPSLEWIRRHGPDTLKRARYTLLPKDYIRCILTGSAASEPTDAAGTFLFDIGERAWSVRILETLGIRPDLLPPIIATESVAGNLLAKAATGLGVPPGIPVAAGSSDLAAALAAVGVDEPGTVAMSTGGTVATTITKQIVDSRLHTLCYTADNTWTLMGATLAAGASLAWFRDVVDPRRSDDTDGDVYERMSRWVSSTAPGAEGLFFAPYLNGDRTPHMDPNARACFVGLKSSHTRAHLARAVMEGVVYFLNESVLLFRRHDVPIRRVVTYAGGSRSQAWRQILTDMLDYPVEWARTSDASVTGTAALAARAIGEIVPTLVAESGATTYPDPTAVAVYRRRTDVYRDLHRQLAPTFRQMQAIEEGR